MIAIEDRSWHFEFMNAILISSAVYDVFPIWISASSFSLSAGKLMAILSCASMLSHIALKVALQE
jgi:hypothetical protein